MGIGTQRLSFRRQSCICNSYTQIILTHKKSINRRGAMLHAMDYNVMLYYTMLRASAHTNLFKNMTHPPSGVHTQLVTVELSLLSCPALSVLPTGCRNVRRELGLFQPSQMTAPTKKDLTLCHNCPLTLWPARKKNSTRLPKPTAPLPRHPQP